MESKGIRKDKENSSIVAICYDFDKTLSPDDMQAQGFIQSVNFDVDEFWTKSNELASKNDMDQNLAWMYFMKTESEGRILFTKDTLKEYGSKVQLYPGVEKWFDRIRNYGKEKNVIVEHYIISSGLKEMIEGTSVANEFKKIYASTFYYNEKGVAVWPAQAVNYTNKTQYLFRIEKGMLDVNDQAVNDHIEPQDIRVPFQNMIYIGDSDTDVPCMKLVNSFGGHSIGVYCNNKGDKSKVFKMLRESRIRYFASADYSEGSELDTIVKRIIDWTAANETLNDVHYSCRAELDEADSTTDKEIAEKNDLINALEMSKNFKRTHDVIQKLSKYQNWRKEEVESLSRIAITNSQVRSIINDIDVKVFYQDIIESVKNKTTSMKSVLNMIENSHD